jgi:glycerol uptake facilitator-like aquaporin
MRADSDLMGPILAATQPNRSFWAFPFVLGLVAIILGWAGTKTGKLTNPPRRRGEWLKTGYQGDDRPPRGITREDNPFAFYYIILCMYFLGALLILTALVEFLIS